MTSQIASAAALSADDQVAKVFEWRRGFNALYLMNLGVRLNLFATLSATPGLSSAELAQRLNLQPRHVGVWCMAAYSLGLLEADGEERFRLAPFFDSILAQPGHPRYLGGYVRLGVDVAAEDFQRCVEAFRSGENKPFQGRGDEFARVIAESTAGLQFLSARKLLPALPGLPERLAQGAAVMEVGCGLGNHLLQLAKAFPHAHIIGLDIDAHSIALARRAVQDAKLTERIEIRAAGAPGAVPEASCAAVVMIEVLHEIAPAARAGVLNSCYRALQPGGWLMIIDETYPSNFAQARQAEFRFPIQTAFEELVWGNVVPTREEQEELLRSAGFGGEIQRTLVGEGFTVLSTQR